MARERSSLYLALLIGRFGLRLLATISSIIFTPTNLRETRACLRHNWTGRYRFRGNESFDAPCTPPCYRRRFRAGAHVRIGIAGHHPQTVKRGRGRPAPQTRYRASRHVPSIRERLRHERELAPAQIAPRFVLRRRLAHPQRGAQDDLRPPASSLPVGGMCRAAPANAAKISCGERAQYSSRSWLSGGGRSLAIARDPSRMVIHRRRLCLRRCHWLGSRHGRYLCELRQGSWRNGSSLVEASRDPQRKSCVPGLLTGPPICTQAPPAARPAYAASSERSENRSSADDRFCRWEEAMSVSDIICISHR